jgi:hypothetical protein
VNWEDFKLALSAVMVVVYTFALWLLLRGTI